MPSTKKIIERLGEFLFYTIFFGLPFMVFHLYYQGRPVGNWFDNIEWYEVVARIFYICLALIIYCLFMYGIRFTIFEPLWAKTVNWYANKALLYGEEDKSDDANKKPKDKKNDMDDKTQRERRHIFQRRQTGDDRVEKPDQPQRSGATNGDKISDPTGLKPPPSI